MENPDKKELIDGISALLKAHEEPYEPGSWEKFSAHKKNKRPKAIAWISIAAALAVIMSAVPYLLKQNDTEPLIVKQKPVQQKKQTELPEATAPEPVEPQISLNRVVTDKRDTNSSKASYKKNRKELITDTAVSMEIAAAVKEMSTVNDIGSVKEEHNETNVAVKQKPVLKENFTDFLKKETESTKFATAKKTSRWDFGVEVSPTVIQSKVNMGAGLTTEFKLSKKFSISSGIAYVALDASKNVDQQPIGLLSNRKLVSIDANISGIDIPLSLTYNLNKKIYTSVGISYFNVIDEQRNNKYLTELQVSRTFSNPQTGVMETSQAKLTEENAEISSETPLDGKSYLGFFNLSMGHKQEVFKNYNIVIEPFLKIPVGKLSNEDLKLSNGGVKLRFTF